MQSHIPSQQQFNFTGKTKTTFLGIAALGAILVAIGFVATPAPMARFWANFMLSNFFFTAIAILSLAFICIKYAAKAGWASGFKRLTEAFSGYLPISFAFFIIIIIASFIGDHNGFKSLYEWMDKDIVANDKILQGKSAYLNFNGFVIRIVVYFGLWIFFRRMFRMFSLKEDQQGGLLYFEKSNYWSVVFLPIFGLTFCFSAFDWFMSTEPHWFSTIYAVNVFAGSLVALCTVTVISLTLLRRNGYFEWITENHFHDLGKFMFGFSIFWAYTWVAQFLLIWFANLPEEIPYYLRRLQGNWQILFFTNFGINFILPLLALMMRDGKRLPWFLITVGGLLLCGRFIDWYLLIMPGTVGVASGFGFYEVGFFVFFAGIFGYSTCYQLSKAGLLPVNHPYIEESLSYEI